MSIRGLRVALLLSGFCLSALGCGDDDAVAGTGGSGGAGGTSGTGGEADASDDASADAAFDATSELDAGADASDVDASDAAIDAGDAGVVRPEFEALFDTAIMPTFEITIPQASWDALVLDPDTYQTGTLRYGDTTLENVGIRLKGRASLRPLDGKPAFKIKFNEFVSGQRLMGLKRLTLNNLVQDPSMARERLAYTMYRAAGLPAPLANHARVYVNGTFYGVYLNLQTLDEEFVDARWPGETGNLYDTSNDTYHVDFQREMPPDPPTEEKFELETNKTANDTSDLTALIDAVSTPSDEQVVAAIRQVMDLDEVLALGAAQAIIADWDGYFGARNNYKIYHELNADRFVMFPWGTDQTFGVQNDESMSDVHTWYTMLDYDLHHGSSGRISCLIIQRCEHDLACDAQYVDSVRDALAVFEAADLESVLDDILLQIGASVAEDTKQEFNAQQRADSIADLRDFLSQRAQRVRDQLAVLQPL